MKAAAKNFRGVFSFIVTPTKDDGEAIELLAKRFQVSTAAMSNRLANLKMLV